MSAVVVGVSPTSGSPNALRFGADEAQLRSLPLRAVMAWRPPRPPAAPGGRLPASTVGTPEHSAAGAEEALREFVGQAVGDGAKVEYSVVQGSAVNALLSEAEDAFLLVVGEPRAGAAARVRASLVAPQVVLKARCPVVVMPAGG